MKRSSIIIGLVLLVKSGFAQLDFYDNEKNDKFIFPIDSVRNLNDSTKFVRIILPENTSMQQNQECIVLGNKRVRNDAAVSTIGKGKFQLIIGRYTYFMLYLNNKDSAPQKNDLLFTSLYYPAKFTGRIYNLIRKAVYLKISTGDSVYAFNKAMYLDEKSENVLIKILSDDIHLVAKEMKRQKDRQDQLVKGGIFNGKKLFDAMEISTADHVMKFLDYVIARPLLYAGNAWNISEIFATWIVGGTPQVINR